MLNGFDLAIMRQMLVGSSAADAVSLEARDMNADGSFSTQDAVTLMKFLLG